MTRQNLLRRIARRFGAYGDYNNAHNDDPAPLDGVLRDFDELTDEEIEALEASVGASGARRPPSE